MTSAPPTGPALFDLTGRTALVTGASRGLGLQMAGALARAGADLVITARKVDDLTASRAALEAHGHRVTPLSLDLRSESSIRDCAAAAIEAVGAIDILLNNAGCNIRKGVSLIK
jgi:gluconate 5-dehydrogenase